MPEEITNVLLRTDRRALASAISLVESDESGAAAIARAIYGQTGRAQVVGVTGAPGVGKSTLVSGLVREFRAQGDTVAVLAVDPSSPFSGGAVLGDRVRMAEHASDDGVFIRSISSRGHIGGLSRLTSRILDLLDAAAFDKIIVETVGSGQSEVEIAGIVQTVIVVVAPGLGDDIQALKAGILEIASIVVVNKADMPLAEKAEAYLRATLSLGRPAGSRVPVLRTSARSGAGLTQLLAAVREHARTLGEIPQQQQALTRARRLLVTGAASRLRALLEKSNGAALDQLCDEFLRGAITLDTAVARALQITAEAMRLDERSLGS
jgi:LAO/AO transport system kinase